MSRTSERHLLVVDDLHLYYDTSYVVQGVSLEVGEAEVVAVLGRNGAGKTTTLKGIMGLHSARRGRVRLADADVTKLAPHARARSGLGYVPQERLLFSSLTVEQNLLVASRGDRSGLEEAYELFPRLGERTAQHAGTLSGGEQQMVAIARALMTHPRLLLLDEPSTGLMPGLVEKVRDVILELRERGVSTLIVEEKVPLAFAVATRAYLMDSGKMVYEGETSELEHSDLLVKHLGVSR